MLSQQISLKVAILTSITSAILAGSLVYVVKGSINCPVSSAITEQKKQPQLGQDAFRKKFFQYKHIRNDDGRGF